MATHEGPMHNHMGHFHVRYLGGHDQGGEHLAYWTFMLDLSSTRAIITNAKMIDWCRNPAAVEFPIKPIDPNENVISLQIHYAAIT